MRSKFLLILGLCAWSLQQTVLCVPHGVCYEKDEVPVELDVLYDDDCVDVDGNIHSLDSELFSCCDCFRYKCEEFGYWGPGLPSWEKQKKVGWVRSLSEQCCQNCNGTVYPTNTVISTTMLEDDCLTTQTEVCKVRPGLKTAVIEQEFSYRNCCNDNSKTLQYLGTEVPDPRTCSIRKCEYEESWPHSVWITEKELEGCDCCLLPNGTLVADGAAWWDYSVTPPQMNQCCRGQIVTPVTIHANTTTATSTQVMSITSSSSVTTTPATTTKTTSTPGLVISGGAPIDIAGTAVEVFVPSTGQHCLLPSLPGGSRADHSINENIVCGGGPYNSDPNYTGHDETRSSCLTLASNGTWLETTRLLEQRYHHSSWASPWGLFLLGGRGSKRTTEKIEEDGTSSYSFELKYDLDLACSINLGSTVIVTGNRDVSSQTRVTEYSEAGFSRDLPLLQQGRYQHGCSYYDNGDGTKTLLVSGGYGHVGGEGYRSSTELLVENASAWVYTGELAFSRAGLRGTNIDNKLMMTGGNDENWTYTDEILEFDPLTGQWELVDRMIQARSQHEVSVINFDPGLCVSTTTTTSTPTSTS